MTNPAGTANIIHQFAAHRQLCEDYTREVANTLTQKSLARHTVFVTVEDVDAWYRINSAAANLKLDIAAERSVASALADAAVAAVLETVANPSTSNAPGVFVAPSHPIDESDAEDDVEDDVEDDDDGNELSSLADLYGYEIDEDNDEAALDDVLKAQERAD